MFIRWKTRRGKALGDHLTLTAVLLESHRIDGQPRQKYVARLGTLRVLDELLPYQDPDEYTRVDGGIAHIARVIWFWNGLTEQLDALDLREQRQAIESQIASRVPKPTDEMLEQTS